MPKYVGDAIDLSQWSPPQRRRVADDGDVIVEKLPSMPSVLMLDLSGNSRHVPRANGMGKPIANDPYWVMKKSEKEAAGFIPYGKCPKAEGLHQFVPKAIADTPPCKVAADGHPAITNAHPCACVVAIQAARQKRNAKQDAEAEKRWKSREAKDVEQRDAVFQKFMENQNQLSEKKRGKAEE